MEIEDKINSVRILVNDLGNAISDCVNVSPEVFEDPLLVEQIKDFRWIYDRNTEKLKGLCGISCSPMQNSILNGILADFVESYKILSTSLVIKIESSKYQEASRLQIIYDRVKGLQNLFVTSNDLPDCEETNLYKISSQKTVSQDLNKLEHILNKELGIYTSC